MNDNIINNNLDEFWNTKIWQIDINYISNNEIKNIISTYQNLNQTLNQKSHVFNIFNIDDDYDFEIGNKDPNKANGVANEVEINVELEAQR